MARVEYEVLEDFNPKKHKGLFTKTQTKCIQLLKKGTIITPVKLINDNVNYLATFASKNKHRASSQTVFSTLKIARGLGIIRAVDNKPIPFDDFCNLECVSYFADQLRGSKNKNLKENRKLVSTKKDYLYRCWEFNNWLHGKTFDFKIVRHLSESTFETKIEKITLDGLEHLLNLYNKSFNTDSDYVRVIKRFLNDAVHQKCSVGYMKLKHVAIMSFFEKNECDIRFKYDPNTNHHDYREESDNATLSLDDLGEMLRVGKASTLDYAVVLSKFQRGLDNSTLCDRFNFQVWDQLVEYFGTDVYEKWDLQKCPVPIRLTRVKTTYTHTGYLDYDAIVAIQKYLKTRYEKTGTVMQSHTPLFLNARNQPISYMWVMNLIPRLAKNAGIQKKINNSELTQRNEKTSHELRDLLKSTLIVEGVADYVCELAIGHKVGDSYSKMDKLYPQKSRMEYAKASSKINIVSKMKSAINEDYSTIAELESKIQDLEDYEKRFDDKIAESEKRFDERLNQFNRTTDAEILSNHLLAEKYTKEIIEYDEKLAKKNGIEDIEMTTDQAIVIHNNMIEKKK